MTTRPILFVALLAAAAQAQRTTVDLAFGWRTINAKALPPPSGCTFNISLNNQRCMGLNGAGDAKSAAACAAAACATYSQAWQWLDSQGCWIGTSDQCGPSSDPWVGATSPGSPKPGPPPPPANSAQAQPAYDDSAWPVVDIPNDNTVTGNYSSSANGGEGFLPEALSWYRKKFAAPLAWKGQAVTLIVDAALSTTTWWLNGNQVTVQNPTGYLPYVLRLDTNGLTYNASTPNVLAAYVDGSITTGWWYEGSGLTRGARIIVSSPSAAIAPFGISSPAFVEGDIHPHTASPADGLYADSAVMSPTVTTFGSSGSVDATFTLLAADGTTVVATGTAKGRAGDTMQSSTLNLRGPLELWSVPRPYLYTLTVSLSVNGQVVDSASETVGIRNIAWDAERGLLLNEQRVKMRGACNHESFTGVGAALPDRIDLLRVQQMRGVGMNAWRTSHNPPEPVLLDIADRLGILVLDENRVLADTTNCNSSGCRDVPYYAGDPAADMGNLALRDRNHASVTWYSLCNEAGCGDGTLMNGDLVERAKEASYTNDGSRAVGANMGWLSPVNPRTPMSDALDVMGMSHAGGNDVAAFHEREPGKPLAMTECCSCENQRGEDGDLPHNSTLVHYTDEVSGCLHDQVLTSDAPEYVAGTFVWTLHDYMGEPGNWPHVSSSFGAIDLAGFNKPPSWWYRSVWLANISATDAGRPPIANAAAANTVRIVESWAPPAAGTTRTVHVYSNAPLVALFLNGAAVGSPLPVPYFSQATFTVTYAAGTLVAKALAADGVTVLATHSISSWGAAVGLTLTMDVPSLLTGTGSAVFVDGKDVALLRATIVDAQGNVVRDSTPVVTFAVTAGPGFVAGVGNGDPACQEPSQSSSRSAYHGLARGIIRVTVDASGPPADRALRALVNVDAGNGALSRASSILQGPASGAPTSITVTATAPGLATATITIPLSIDPKDSVLAVASASIASADLGLSD